MLILCAVRGAGPDLCVRYRLSCRRLLEGRLIELLKTLPLYEELSIVAFSIVGKEKTGWRNASFDLLSNSGFM